MPLTSESDILRKLCYDAGRLVTVEHAFFCGDPEVKRIHAVRLTFEYCIVIIRAVPEDDTIAVGEDISFPEPGEEIVTATGTAPWVACVGRKVRWAWRLTNQQGYEDAFRLEFEDWQSGVELVVGASTIHLYVYNSVA